MATVSYDAEKNHIILQFTKKDTPLPDLVSNLSVRGFPSAVPMVYSEERATVKYDLSGLISWRQRASCTLEVTEFYTLLKSFFVGLRTLFSIGVSPVNLDLDPDNIFINEFGQVFFLVYPVANRVPESDLFTLIKTLITKFKPLYALDEQTIQSPRDNLGLVESGQLPSEGYLLALEEYVTDYLLKNTFDNTRLSAFMNGTKASNLAEEQESSPSVLQGVEVDMDVIMDVYSRTTMFGVDDDDADLGATEMDLGATEMGAASPAVSNRVYTLSIVHLGNAVATVQATEGRQMSWSVGRSSDNDLPLSGFKPVSRQHGTLLFDGEEFSFMDIGSGNGSLVDGVMLRQGMEAPVSNGSSLGIGRETFSFVITED